jgi:hypothetical protein
MSARVQLYGSTNHTFTEQCRVRSLVSQNCQGFAIHIAALTIVIHTVVRINQSVLIEGFIVNNGECVWIPLVMRAEVHVFAERDVDNFVRNNLIPPTVRLR